MRLPADVRQQLLNAIHEGRPFRLVLSDLGLTPNQVWGLTSTDEEWSERLEAALTATRREDLTRHHACVCPRLRLQRVPGVSEPQDGQEPVSCSRKGS
jgi:hypothetical protein